MNDLAISMPRRSWPASQYALRPHRPAASMGLYVGAFVRSDPRLRAARPADQHVRLERSRTREPHTASLPHPFSAFGLSPVHLRPDGRGTVRLKSPDPLAPPEIRFNFLDSDYDFQALIYGMRHRREIASSRR